MGCGSSSQTKVVEFKEPESPKSSKQKKQSNVVKPSSENVVKSSSVINGEVKDLKTETNVFQQELNQKEDVLNTVYDEAKPHEEEVAKPPVAEKEQVYGPTSHITGNNTQVDGNPIITEDGVPIKQINFDRKLCKISSKTKPSQPADKLTFIHFNDVYNIEPRDTEPVGGAARFVTKVQSFPNEAMVLFSGDCLNPSLMSSVTKGKQMVPVMNAIGVHASVFGNHDFDFGVDELIEFKNKTTFPWLMSNVKDKLTKTLLADGIEKIVAEWYGRKIGIIGLVEEEWLVTLATIDPEDVEYTDFVECARELVAELKDEQGCAFIIALTHMRIPNDARLLESDVEIDLILGGHDHHYETKEHNGKTLVKSGTDFRELTEIVVDFSNNKSITTERHEITEDIVEDESIKKECEKYSIILGQKMTEVLGLMEVDLDGRFSTVRTKESNLGNFICDIMRAATQSDIALLNSGSLRSDMIHTAGPFKMKDLVSILPMIDSCVVLIVTGKVLLEVLENSVSQYPKCEGRFLQVSGVSFVFDPEQPAGQRISQDTVKVHENIPISLEREYSVVTKEYLWRGKDGFDMLKPCKVLVDGENGPILSTIVENHFESIRIYKGRRKSISGHRQSITVKHDEVQTFMEEQRSKLAPSIEGRIRVLGEPENVISPNFIRRKSKLRLGTVSTSSIHNPALSDIEENELTEEKQILEEIEEDDSDIDSVMESDITMEEISDDDKMNLWEACRLDDLDKVKEIAAERTLDFKFWIMEKTLLHHATQHNAVKCIEYLLNESNLHVNVRDQILKSTALFYVAEHGGKEAAVLLVDNKARVNAKNTLWETPLHVACEYGQGEIIIILLARGADRTLKNKEGEKPKI